MAEVHFPDIPRFAVYTNDRSFDAKWEGYSTEKEAVVKAGDLASTHDSRCIFYVMKAIHKVTRANVAVENISDLPPVALEPKPCEKCGK